MYTLGKILVTWCKILASCERVVKEGKFIFLIFLFLYPSSQVLPREMPTSPYEYDVSGVVHYWHWNEIGSARHSEEKALIWCFNVGLLKSEQLCPGCGSAMYLYKDLKIKRWRCNKTSCLKEVSRKTGSFFAKSNLPMHKLVHILWLWSGSTSGVSIMQIVKISKPTLIDWLNFIRDIVRRRCCCVI